MRMNIVGILGAIVIFGVGFLIAYRVVFHAGEKRGLGFMDYVKNPAAQDQMQEEYEDYFKAIGELAKQPPEVVVDMLLEDADSFGMPARAIELMGPKAVPALLAAVVDPRFRGGNQKDEFGDRTLEPLEGVLSCLEEFAPPEAVPVLLPLVADKNDAIRKQLALLLGRIATDEAAAPMIELLREEHKYIRSYAVMGILRALDANQVSAGFRSRVFEALTPLALAKSVPGNDEVPRCLLKLDRERAAQLLTDKNILQVDQENLDEILAALREENVHADVSILLDLLDKLEGKTGYRADRQIGEALKLLVLVAPNACQRQIENAMQHASQDVREYAMEAKALSLGIEDPFTTAFEKLDQVGWYKLTEPQKHVLAVRVLINEVENGGFLQYFVNSSGDHWQDALRGLGAIRATTDARLFKRVIAPFGPNGPSVDRRSRHEQVATIASQRDRPFDAMESEFYDDAADREVLLLRYILRHAKDFSPPPTP